MSKFTLKHDNRACHNANILKLFKIHKNILTNANIFPLACEKIPSFYAFRKSLNNFYATLIPLCCHSWSSDTRLALRVHQHFLALCRAVEASGREAVADADAGPIGVVSLFRRDIVGESGHTQRLP